MEEVNHSPLSRDDSVFERLEAYPWESDEEFQGGLKAILGPNPTPEQATELTLRARCFYYSRKHNVPVDFDSYKFFRTEQGYTNRLIQNSSLTQSASQPFPSSSQTPTANGQASPSSDQNAPYPTSFAHIVDLITKGEPVPGIKDIPDTVLSGQESQTTKTQRKKPWEKEGEAAQPEPLESPIRSS